MSSSPTISPLVQSTSSTVVSTLPNLTFSPVTPVISLPQLSPYAITNDSPPHHTSDISTSSPLMHTDEYTQSERYYSLPISSNTHLMSIQEDEGVAPTSSPVLRSGRIVGGMRKLLRIPSSGHAGVAPSSVQAENPSIAMVTDHSHHDFEQTDRNRALFKTVLTHIKKPRPGFSKGLRRHRIHRKRQRVRERHQYSDDGYTSDPGMLRDAIRDLNEEDPEEEDDTESGDHVSELRAQRISGVETKLEKYKRLLQEEEIVLKDVKNDYVHGMEGSLSDKDSHRITQRFMTRESKAKDTIDHLKKKVEKYDEQLQYFKKGTLMPLPQQPRYGHKVRNHFKKIGGMKNEIRQKLNRKKKHHLDGPQDPIDIENDDLEEVNPEEEDEELLCLESQSLVNEQLSLKDDLAQHCELCLHEYQSLADVLNEQKQEMADMQQKYGLLFAKLQAERDKSERLEGDLNTLMDLHQNGVSELREQLSQMERLTFSKNQDLEDTIDNCQGRLHKLEVQIDRNIDRIETPVTVGWIRRIVVPTVTVLLDLLSITFKLSEHMGKKTLVSILVIFFAIFVFYIVFNRL